MNLQMLMASPVTLALLAANIFISLAAFRNERLLESMLFDMARVRHKGEYHRMITSGFVHGDPMHLFMNMLALFLLGPALEITVGPAAYLGVYMASLLGGSLWTFMDHYRDMNYRALGASGAVSGVISAAAIFYPLETIYLFFALPMPFIVFTLLFVGWSAWAATTRVRDGIGHAAHLGGALTGIGLVCVIWPAHVRQSWDQIVQAVLPF